MDNKKFSLPLIGVILFLVVAVILVGLALKNGASAHTAGYITGLLVSSLLFASLLSWVIWRISGRSEPAKNIVFCLILALIGVQQLAQVSLKKRTSTQSKEIHAALDDYQAQLREDLDSNGFIATDTNRTDAMIQRLQSTAGKLPSSEKTVLEAGTRVLRKMQTYESKYQQAAEKLTSEDILRPIAITNLANIQQHRAGITNFLNANEELKDVLAQGPTLFQQELAQSNLSDKMIEGALRGYRASSTPRTKIILEIRQQDNALGTNLLAMLDLYQSQWGRWTCTTNDDGAKFQDPAQHEKYIAIIDNIIALGEQQEAAQQKLVNLKLPTP